MGNYKDYVNEQIDKMSRKDLDFLQAQLKERVLACAHTLRECVLLNKNDKDSPTVWSLAMMECILIFSKSQSDNNKDKFDYIITTFCKQIMNSKEAMLKEWDNG